MNEKKIVIVCFLIGVFLGYVFAEFAFSQERDNYASQTILNWAYNDDTGGFNVDLQDQTTRPFDLFFERSLAPSTTLSAQATLDGKTITVTDTTGFVDGTRVGIFSLVSNDFYFGQQQGAPSGSVITLDSPLNYAFAAGSIVRPLSRELNVDGSVTPVTFEIQGPGGGTQIDITRIMVKVLCDSAVSLSTFCDLTALTNGVVLRIDNDNGIQNVWNVKTTGDFGHLAYDLSVYSGTNPQQGQDGFLIRYTFAAQDKHGVAVRLSLGDAIQLIVQDDLSDLDLFRVIAQGHFVED